MFLFYSQGMLLRCFLNVFIIKVRIMFSENAHSVKISMVLSMLSSSQRSSTSLSGQAISQQPPDFLVPFLFGMIPKLPANDLRLDLRLDLSQSQSSVLINNRYMSCKQTAVYFWVVVSHTT